MTLFDSGCNKTVCAEQWLKVFIDTLSLKDVSSIIAIPSDTVLRFVDSKIVKSNMIFYFY